ncbi:sulfurtransferase [Alkalisalibacterium limincola]|uniref:Sulfurtransferase n=1 Tax=Alkalisalibacterium limincola TaxID=2699169 RepID=A0A5C8KYN4_9GAMM|nr:sulfurtransferase [Alkalisalibacterium limincola]TXK65927.1 sulfurtransferase [Alkalisalibacterium limincola]
METEWTALVSAVELAANLGDRDVVVVDCRASLADPGQGRRDWLSAHIPGARHARLEDELSGPAAAAAGRHPLPASGALCAHLGAWGIMPSTQVVAYDAADGAMAAARLWWLLRSLGHRRAAVLDGGLAAWRDAGLPLQEGEESWQPALYADPGYLPGEWLDSDELRARLDHTGHCLVDARAAERFRGEVEPIDPVAGHIPGARNRPYTANLQDSGLFKPASQLREEWEELIAPNRPADVLLMCGSGVTACHHRLAMAHAGLEGARVYAPSWSGWISDPARPVATGQA